MPLVRLFGRDPVLRAAHEAYVAIVERAREPRFYAAHGMPDTLDGRFELIALHAFLVLHRIKGDPAAQAFGQVLFDTWFGDMDRSLREMGTGDLSVGKQVKRMATAFYGRISAYQAGLGGTGDLIVALKHNLFGTVAEPDPADIDWFAAYLRRESAFLAGVPAETIAGGRVAFSPFPDEEAA